MSHYQNDAERIYQQWDAALTKNDMAGLLILYADDAIIESPLIPHVLPTPQGIIKGKAAIRQFIECIIERKPALRNYYRTPFFTDGTRLMWEHPRLSPSGEQMDFVEVMDLQHGLIHYHRVYWGWRGVKVMQDNAYHR